MTADQSYIAVVAAIISACAAIASAVISALISWSVSKRSRSQKVAEFRQEWIEKLRIALADFTSTVISYVDKESHDDVVWSQIVNKKSYIFLMLNHAEVEHLDLYKCILKLNPKQIKALNDEEQNKLITELQHKASIVLKREWDRLKAEISNTSRKGK